VYPSGRPHCSRYRRHGPGALRKQLPTLLQHVGEIPQERAAYYHILEQTQSEHGFYAVDGVVLGMPWPRHRWCANCAQHCPRQGVAINDRQRLVLNRLLDGFEGKLTTTKYAKLTKSSQDTARRDLGIRLSRAFWFAVQKEAAVQVMRLRTFLDRTRSNRGLHPRCSRLATNRGVRPRERKVVTPV
jgi:hypothetical protein